MANIGTQFSTFIKQNLQLLTNYHGYLVVVGRAGYTSLSSKKKKVKSSLPNSTFDGMELDGPLFLQILDIQGLRILRMKA